MNTVKVPRFVLDVLETFKKDITAKAYYSNVIFTYLTTGEEFEPLEEDECMNALVTLSKQLIDNAFITAEDLVAVETPLILPYDLEPVFQTLPPDEAAALIKAIFVYGIRGEEPNFEGSPVLSFTWKTNVKQRIDELNNRQN
ncbi:MAG: hypothetical protein IKK97_02485 [Phascolarctobacterium sp.]|nr:hypothetical protein [Phascolarctobacterium sp.]